MISSTSAKPDDTKLLTAAASAWKKRLGDLGETSACRFLTDSRWTIVEKKWRAGRLGEIDIVAVSPDSILVVIEVKTRCRNPDFALDWQSSGFASVNARKQKKLRAMAAIYINFRAKYMRNGHDTQDRPVRIDCILVDFPLSSASLRKLLDEGKLDEVPLPNFVHVENAVAHHM